MDCEPDVLKEDIRAGKKAVFERLVKQCETYFSVELPKSHPPSSTTFMGIAMANLALAYILTDEKRYLYEARRWIMTAVNYPHWGNAHLVDVDLSAAWILFGMGISYDWLKESFTQDERKAVKEKILLQGGRMFAFKVETEGSGWSTNYWQNHNWINMTGLSAAAYALVKEGEDVQQWIDSARANFDFVFSVMPEDGSDYEGVVYWRYGAMWLYVYAHLLKEREGIDYFETSGFLRNSFEYRLYQAAPNLEEQIGFGDAHDRRSGHSTAIYYKTAAEYKNGYAQKLGNLVRDEFLEREAELSKVKPGILPECFFEVLFYDPMVEEKEFDDLPLEKFFDDLGLYVKRTSWERDAAHFSFKCSNPGGRKQWSWLWKLKEEKNYNCFGLSHQHPDNNSFLFNYGGHFFAIDDGYNRTVKASDHNVILVDGVGYEGEGQNNIWKNYTPEMKGEIISCELNDDYSYLAGETAAVYKKELKMNKCRRHLFSKSGSSIFFMIDELVSELPHTYTWQMYSDVYPDVYGDCYRYSIGNAEMDLFVVSEREVVMDLNENTVRAVMTTQEPDKFTENHMKGIRISNKELVEKQSFISALVPRSAEADHQEIEKVQCDGAYGLSTGHDERVDYLLYSPSGYLVFMDTPVKAKLAHIEVENNKISKILELVND